MVKFFQASMNVNVNKLLSMNLYIIYETIDILNCKLMNE